MRKRLRRRSMALAVRHGWRQRAGAARRLRRRAHGRATTAQRVAQDACQQAYDLFQFMAPQLGVAVAGGNATLGQRVHARRPRPLLRSACA